MRSYLRLLIPLAFAFVIKQAYAGAWTQAQGQGQIILTGDYYFANDSYTNAGNEQSQPAYRKFELNPYVEYGYSDSITLGANVSLQRASQSHTSTAPSQTNWGLGDSEFFIRKRLWQGSGFVVSVEPLVKLPSPQSSGQDAPLLGGAHPDVAMGLSGGYGFSVFGQNHFIGIDTQYRYRFGPQRDQLKLTATAGFHMSERWMVMPQLFRTYRVSTPSVTTYTNSSADDYNATRLQLSGVYSLNDATSLQLGGFDDVNGKNTGHGKGVLLAIWKKF